MAQHDSAPSEPTHRLTEIDGTFALSIGEICGAALQKVIEADVIARIGAEPGIGPRLARSNATVTVEGFVDPGRGHRGHGPEAAQGQLLPGAARAALPD